MRPNDTPLPIPGRCRLGVDRASRRRPRIALYSHDTVGLGHIRRNQLIAKALAGSPLNASILLITGVRQGGAFAVPDGIDSLSLPAYRKGSDGAYRTRSLEMPVAELTHLRSRLIDTALAGFDPDLFIADNVPRGACGELLPALARLRRDGRTRCVLGLRDILDEPAAIVREWRDRDNFAAIRDYFDAVWVYGDPAVYDTVAQYDFPADVRQRTVSLGYLDPALGHDRTPACDTHSAPLILCSVGGGEDGFRLASEFAAAHFPEGTRGVLVTGPLMPNAQRQALSRLIAARTNLQLIDAIYDPTPLIRRASGVIAMAGYNSVNEILAYHKRALLVPRTAPRKEQWIRAWRMAELGLADVLPADAADARSIGDWIAGGSIGLDARTRIDFGGLQALVHEAARLLGETAPSERETQPEPSRVAACG